MKHFNLSSWAVSHPTLILFLMIVLGAAGFFSYEKLDRAEDPACAETIARLQAALFDWALHPKMHITTPNAKIAAYAENQMQVKGGILIGIWDEAELAAIRAKLDTRSSP